MPNPSSPLQDVAPWVILAGSVLLTILSIYWLVLPLIVSHQLSKLSRLMNVMVKLQGETVVELKRINRK